jgi:hypothetical protein
VLFVCDFVVFGGYLLRPLLVPFVRRCQCYFVGDGYKIFVG